MSVTAFDQVSRGVASRFLNTVVVVDDQALLAASPTSERPGVLKVPGRQGGPSSGRATESPTPTADSVHWLDAKALIDSFARIGIVCAVLRPKDQEIGTLESILSPIAAGSDVVVLDWVLHEFKQGEKTIEVIKKLLTLSGTQRGRARLIIVYTGENDLDGIAASIRAAVKLPEQLDSDDPFTIECGAARICIYAKEQSRLTADKKTRKVEFAKLPEVVVGEFTNMTRGLVSNVALMSLAALRENTYQLLKRFHRQIDPPYVTHSTLLRPEAASDHLIPLIVSEIQSVLEDAEVAELASPKRVVQWLKHQLRRGLTLTPPQHTSDEEAGNALAYLLEHGVSKQSLETLFTDHRAFSLGFLKNKEKADQAVRDNLTNTVTLARDRQDVNDHELAVLMSVRSRYGSPPHLTLGSIVLETRKSRPQYLLCMQPRCDSVRLDNPRFFPFLPMKPVSSNGECTFIIEEKSKTIRLRLNSTPFEVRMIKFSPGTDRRVLARRGKNGRYFKAPETKSTYRWVADLKPEHAQRVANVYAHKLSRVGLTESEWLRKWTPALGE